MSCGLLYGLLFSWKFLSLPPFSSLSLSPSFSVLSLPLSVSLLPAPSSSSLFLFLPLWPDSAGRSVCGEPVLQLFHEWTIPYAESSVSYTVLPASLGSLLSGVEYGVLWSLHHRPTLLMLTLIVWLRSSAGCPFPTGHSLLLPPPRPPLHSEVNSKMKCFNYQKSEEKKEQGDPVLGWQLDPTLSLCQGTQFLSFFLERNHRWSVGSVVSVCLGLCGSEVECVSPLGLQAAWEHHCSLQP